MKHGERFFSIEENQVSWEKYLSNIMEQWDAENKDFLEQQQYTDEEKEEKIKKLSGYSYKGKSSLTPYKYEYRRKKQSVQQYKPILLDFEEFVGKSFNEITAEDMEKFAQITSKVNKLNHFNAFFRDCVSSGIIRNRNKDFLIALLPEVYRSIGIMLMQGGENVVDKEMTLSAKGMMKCVFCGKEEKATAEKWMLIQKNGRSIKYLTCRECEGRDGEYRY